MISIVSEKIAKRIKSVVPEHPRSEKVLAYSISFLLTNLSVIVLSLLISLFTGKFLETVIVLISFALLRNISGGFHLETAWLCIILSTTIVTIIAFSNFGYFYIIVLTSISLILTMIYSPRIERQTRIPKKYYPVLKILSMVIILISSLLGTPLVTSAFFVQSVTLIRSGRGVTANQ